MLNRKYSRVSEKGKKPGCPGWFLGEGNVLLSGRDEGGHARPENPPAGLKLNATWSPWYERWA